jgi:RHS repeat-associated protein
LTVGTGPVNGFGLLPFYTYIGERLTDSNGTLVSTYQYDPYGNLTSSTGSVANPWRFAGGYFDSSTGLYKFGTRYYNPGFGRWSQQDPVRGQLNDPTLLNRYLYASDDPVNVTDPSGAFHLGPALQDFLAETRGINGLALLVGLFDPSLGSIVHTRSNCPFCLSRKDAEPSATRTEGRIRSSAANFQVASPAEGGARRIQQ